MCKIIFSNKEDKKINGSYILGDRNQNEEIIIYKNCDDMLNTLIHEVIHMFLYRKARKGYKTRVLDKINHDETFVNGLAIIIAEKVREHKDKLIE